MTKVQINIEDLLSEFDVDPVDVTPKEKPLLEEVDEVLREIQHQEPSQQEYDSQYDLNEPLLPNDQDEWPEPHLGLVGLNRLRPDDPSDVEFYPPTLPIEVALQTASMNDIRIAYGFSEAQWALLVRTERFKSDVEQARKMLAEEGMSFKAKARLQSEELLKTSWQLIHDRSGEVPPNVKADLIKFTIRAAGLEAKAADNAQSFTPLQININI